MFSVDITSVLNAVIEGVFWAAMVSYVSLSLMKLFAVARPISYKHHITMVRIMVLIALRLAFY